MPRPPELSVVSGSCIQSSHPTKGCAVSQRAQVLQLWSAALSADSAAQLDIRRFVEQPSQAWDSEMAAEMCWRASALEALQVRRL